MTEPDQRETTAVADDHPTRRASDRPRQNRHIAALATIAVVLVLIGAYYALRKSDAWLIHFNRHQTVRDVAPLHARLAASGLAVSELGRVEYDGAWQPIMVARRSVAGAQRRLCVFAGVHGNEPASVEAGVENLPRGACIHR